MQESALCLSSRRLPLSGRILLPLAILSVLGTMGCGTPTGTTQPTITNFVYVASGEGLSALSADATGVLTPFPGSPFAAGPGPTAIAVHPTGSFVYIVGHDVSGVGGVWAFSLAPSTGVPTLLTGSPFATGTSPDAVAIDPTGKFLFVADFTFGQINVFIIDPGTGALTSAAGSPLTVDGDFWSLVVHPNGKYLYAADDITGNIFAYTIDPATGAIAPLTGSPFPDTNMALDVAIDPSGKYAYTADALFDAALQDDTVSGYSIDSNGALTPLPGSPFPAGGIPHTITVDPSGRFAYTANFTSNNVSGFTIDANTGSLTAMPSSPFSTGVGATSPSSIGIDPSSKFAYVTNQGMIAGFSVDSTGNLTQLPSSPFLTGTSSGAIVITPAK